MTLELQNLLYQAEAKYLSLAEITDFKKHVSSLESRLEVYEILRDREVDIFQAIADRLSSELSQEKQERLERGLKNWLLIVRSCAIAMLLNDPSFLQHRLLEWLTNLIQAHQLQPIENKIYELLQSQLQQLFTSEQIALLKPFLEQAKKTLLQEKLAHLPG
ncbi:phycobilisome protein [Chroococcidiopsis sp. TS-821]|uniref:phycobilisome protein n=1 Tax=Chroococcidiopsis sp. TS-821 TaxID=1378066 RepID=UPI000CEEEA61|nr:phycobilisome protein [Chroococcidiopsis sp. TS-821]PPS39590.1 phycobilisome protein [Chroococcidiopsis sp. TS-821]